MDRLEDRVSETVYESRRKRLQSQLAGLDVQMHVFDKAEGSYYILGLKLLELAQTAPLMFLNADSDTRHSISLELVDRPSFGGEKYKFG